MIDPDLPPASLRPRPPVTLDNAFWFDAARDHRLVIQRCTGCGKLRHPPGPVCPHCRSTAWDVVVACGRATLYSHVVVHHPPIPPFEYPRPIGLVELAEGTRLVAGLVGLHGNNLVIGMPLELAWEDCDPDLSLPVFRSAATGTTL